MLGKLLGLAAAAFGLNLLTGHLPVIDAHAAQTAGERRAAVEMYLCRYVPNHARAAAQHQQFRKHLAHKLSALGTQGGAHAQLA